MTVVTVSIAILCAVAISAVWVPSSLLADEELERASREQLNSGAAQAAKEVLNYFQKASSQALTFSQMYDLSFASAPDSATERYFHEFGQATWGILRQQPMLSSLLLAQARNPALVNSACDTDAALISTTIKANLNPQTTGAGFPDSVMDEPSDVAPAGSWRLNSILGDANLANPLQWQRTVFNASCFAFYGSRAGLWTSQNLPGDWTQYDTGVDRVSWLAGTQTSGSSRDGSRAVYKKVFFPLQGPHWANKSAVGSISVQVSSVKRTGGGSGSLNDILAGMVSSDARTGASTIFFLLSGEGELSGSSLEQDVELRDEAGEMQGLLPADSDKVQEPIRSVASALIRDNCTLDDAEDGDALRKCDWAGPADCQRLAPINGYILSCVLVVDDHAANLNSLLVNMRREEDIFRPAMDLNEQLTIHGSYIFVAACVMALLVARMVSSPFRVVRDNMFLLGDMKVEESLDRNNKANKCSFTEAKDLSLSFKHAATCLKAWRELEIERRMQLEDEREKRIQNTVEKAVRGAGKLVHPMVLISADAFSKLETLTSYEELRDTNRLVFLDTEEALGIFRAEHSIIFLSHQWLAWGFPDNATKTHLNAMKSAVKSAAKRVGSDGNQRCEWRNVYVWVDYCSIAQEHRGMQMLAVSSLPVYASSADIFVIVAPPAEHQSSRRCDLNTYNARGWCRAEMLAKICSSGLMNFFIFGDAGELEQVTEQRLPELSMYVFEGEFSCCQQRHVKTSCDKEALVEPVLGLYSLVLRQVRSKKNLSHMQPIMEHIRNNKERFFPSAYTFHLEGSREERDLFGSLVECMEQYVQDMALGECAISFDSTLKKTNESDKKSALSSS